MVFRAFHLITVAAVGLASAALAATLPVADARVERVAPDRVAVAWTATKPVDVYVSDKPDATAKTATLVSRGDADGRYDAVDAGTVRRYYLISDTKSGATIRVAERLLPLEQGSNFRDLGGYPAAGGKHVRWGLIYRSGATPMLTDADVARVQALGIKQMVDLRSSEERVLAPTRLTGIEYQSIGYPMMTMTGDRKTFTNGGNLYRNFPTFLAPQLRLIFDDLLAQKGPVVYNCSAGQDRTGFATAMVLSALGVPRATILEDYHLSTAYRRPEYEMPKIDPALAAGNPVAALFASYQKSSTVAKPQPLKDADGRAFLESAFAEIETHWGSVDAYLEKEIGIGKAECARLRSHYLD